LLRQNDLGGGRGSHAQVLDIQQLTKVRAISKKINLSRKKRIKKEKKILAAARNFWSNS
jgi:hypothetical protein